MEIFFLEAVLILFFILPVLFFGPAVFQWIVTLVGNRFIKDEERYSKLIELRRKIAFKKYWVTLPSLFPLLFGTIEMMKYYLTDDYPGLIVITLGLYLGLFILPWMNLKFQKELLMGLKSLIFYHLSTGVLGLWIIALAITNKTIFVHDAGAYRSFETNTPFKIFTIIILIFYYLFSTFLLAIDFYKFQQRRKEKMGEEKEGNGKKRYKIIPLLATFTPLVFLLMCNVLGRLLKIVIFPHVDMLAFPTITFTVINAFISWLFLGRGSKKKKVWGMIFYSLLGVLNIGFSLITIIPEVHIFLFRDVNHQGVNFSGVNYFLLIKVVGFFIFSLLAWLVPYVLYVLKKKRLQVL